MSIARSVRTGVLATGLALGAGAADAALTVTFNGSAVWTYSQVATTWTYQWSVQAPIDAIATTAVFDWSSGLPDGVTADFRATKVPSSGPATEVFWDVVGFGYNLEPGGNCPFVTGGSPLVSPAGAVCAQVLVAPLVENPEFGDALNSMSIRGMTLLDFVAGGDGDWLDTVALSYIETVPGNAYFGSLSFRGTEMPPGLVPADFEPPGGLPPPPFGGTPGGQVPPEFLPPTAVPEPAALGLLGLGLLGLAAARRRAAR
jgi:hypothetical protein